MGTNFYWKQEEKPPCECCQRPFLQKEIHIGKSSFGWCFGLHVTDEIKSLDDWKKIWTTEPGFIEDEYGTRISVEDMINRITNREGRNNFDNLKDYCEPGPNGLVRHKLDNYCIGHGDGTWDLITGEFS